MTPVSDGARCSDPGVPAGPARGRLGVGVREVPGAIRPRTLLVTTLLALALILAAGPAARTQEEPQGEAAPSPPEVQVILRDFQIVLPRGSEGGRLVIPVGTVVRFINEGPSYHNVSQASPEEAYGRQGLFQSPDLAPGESWAYTFETPGLYPILCDFGAHYLLGMTAEIEVTP